MPASASASRTASTKPGCWISRADTLTHRKTDAVDGRPRDAPRGRPRAGSSARSAGSTPFSSAISMKSPGATRPRSGCCQRTSASMPARRAVGQVDDGLVGQPQLAELDGPLELDAQLVALADGRVHARVEDREAGLAVGLGHVHRDVGVAHHVGRRLVLVAGAGDADAGRDRDVMLADAGTASRSSRVRRSAMASDRLRSGASVVRTANSSPPRRATRSPVRTDAEIRSVTACSSASPAA